MSLLTDSLLRYLPSELIRELSKTLAGYCYALGGAYVTKENRVNYITVLARDGHTELLEPFLPELCDGERIAVSEHLLRTGRSDVVEWTLSRLEKGTLPMSYRPQQVPGQDRTCLGDIPVRYITVPGRVPAEFMDRLEALKSREIQAKRQPDYWYTMSRYVCFTIRDGNAQGLKWALEHGYLLPSGWWWSVLACGHPEVLKVIAASNYRMNVTTLGSHHPLVRDVIHLPKNLSCQQTLEVMRQLVEICWDDINYETVRLFYIKAAEHCPNLVLPDDINMRIGMHLANRKSKTY